MTDSYRFDVWHLDATDRRLTRDGAPVDVNARYLDALVLLVRENGRLVTKDRFLEDVWRGVPVTDEALTQCIKTLRRTLGDDASRPRFIETVPKHGYRFVAAIVASDAAVSEPITPVPSITATAIGERRRDTLLLGGAGTVGAGMAGLIGGLIYGFAGAAQPVQAGPGAASVLIVMLCLTILIALLGGVGVAFGIALATRAGDARWRILGGAVGGMVVGAIVKLLGIDAITLLFGRSPGNVTGALEGLALGAAVGLAAWFATRMALRRAILAAGVIGGLAGSVIVLTGGRLLAGSLMLLSDAFPGSRLKFGALTEIAGNTLGPTLAGAFEGGLFAACLVAAITLAERTIAATRRDRLAAVSAP
ncbi:transcriptional regulator [uncultured Sphingomonas sp.]|uniref:winged helix-turn-helix domain-containing protein n=1 Tax=uncultured Sphingomonas sp. TaxID=158754 RepID=UPI0025EE1950|nr:transcriptional regulator [uncultured Sphingomonas sp.]